MATKKPTTKTPASKTAPKKVPAKPVRPKEEAKKPKQTVPSKKVPAPAPKKRPAVKNLVASFAAEKKPPKKPAPPPFEDDELDDLPKPPKGHQEEDWPEKSEPESESQALPEEVGNDEPKGDNYPGYGAPDTKIDKEKLLAFIESIIDTLTFRRVSLVALLIVLGLSVFAIYENRLALVERIVQPPEQPVDVLPDVTNWVLSDQSKNALTELAKTTPINFVIITSVDLKKNRRIAKYYYIDDPTITLTPNAMRSLALPQAFFDYDAKNTAQMVAILNNEFRCDPYEDTINHRYAPELKDKIPYVCRLAIPPFVGQFVGFIAVGISAIPGGEAELRRELDSIRLEMSRIAVDIYMNDVVKKPTGKP